MDYFIGNGKGQFLFGSEDTAWIARDFHGDPLAELVGSLLKIKAMDEYFAGEGKVTQLDARRQYREEIERCKALYEKISGLQQFTATPLSEVPQNDIREAFANRDIGLVARLCAGVAQR